MYNDRTDAGRQLGRVLLRPGLRDLVNLALPRGGVAVAVEVAKLLSAPLDIVLVRKIGALGDEELALRLHAPRASSYWIRR